MKPRKIVTVDIGGTHSRFALATIQDGSVVDLGPCRTLKTADYQHFADAWLAYAEQCDHPLPRAASIAIAAPVRGPDVQMTNGSWSLNARRLANDLNLDRVHLCNDFGAMAYGVAALNTTDLIAFGGPKTPLPGDGSITIAGPGTGFGVALLARRDRQITVVETEGGHIQFAPANEIEQLVQDHLRQRHGRVSIERVLCGGGLRVFASALAQIEGQPLQAENDSIAWVSALSGNDPRWRNALLHYLSAMGHAAGELALCHGANAFVLVGKLAQRLAPVIADSDFGRRFESKGRYGDYMSQIVQAVAMHPELGLLGAAAAFGQQIKLRPDI